MNIVTVILIQKARLLLTRSTAKSKEEIVNIQAQLRCADYVLNTDEAASRFSCS